MSYFSTSYPPVKGGDSTRSRRANRASAALASRRLRSPETREEVHVFHTKRRLFDVPYDPGVDAAAPEEPAGPWAEAEARAEADLRARRAEAEATAQQACKDRQREDRAGTRPYEACKRATGGLQHTSQPPRFWASSLLLYTCAERWAEAGGPRGDRRSATEACSTEWASAADVRRRALGHLGSCTCGGCFSGVVRCSPGAAL